MWICSRHGFYSIVRKGGPKEWQIRARRRRDLENLIEAGIIRTRRPGATWPASIFSP